MLFETSNSRNIFTSCEKLMGVFMIYNEDYKQVEFDCYFIGNVLNFDNLNYYQLCRALARC